MNSKKNTNNNPLLSIGSDSQYSETSVDQTGGGIMNWLLGSSSEGEYATDIALDAFQNGFPHISYFVIRHAIDKSVKLNYSKRDSNKRTLLHHLVLNCKIPSIYSLFLVVMDNTDAKSHINLQDELGNTPTHIAVDEGMDLVVDKLIAMKADLTIANNKNKVIHINNELKKEIPEIFIKTVPKSCNSSLNIQEELSKALEPVLIRTESDTLSGFRRSEAMQDTVMSQQMPTFAQNNQSYSKPKNIFSEDTMSISTDDILNQILNEQQQENQYGGKASNKGVIRGKRAVVTYSENLQSLSGGSDDEYLKDSDFSDISSIARTVENQASEAHKRAIERIKEILKVDETEARAYKAILYASLKEENMSGYDRAMELEKRASNKEVLDKISKKEVKNMIKLIDEKHKQKQSSQSEKSSEPARPKKLSHKKKSSYLSSESGVDTISSIDIE